MTNPHPNARQTSGSGIFLCLSFAALIALHSNAARAQQIQQFGPYKITYMAYNSSYLPLQRAKILGIRPAANLAIVSISVLKPAGGDVPATLRGSTSNSSQQLTPLNFRTFEHEPTTLYVAGVDFSDGDSIVFMVSIEVRGESKPFILQWKQSFWE